MVIARMKVRLERARCSVPSQTDVKEPRSEARKEKLLILASWSFIRLSVQARNEVIVRSTICPIVSLERCCKSMTGVGLEPTTYGLCFCVYSDVDHRFPTPPCTLATKREQITGCRRDP